LTYIRKDGSRFPAVVSVTALRDDRDAIIGYLLIGTDNTARKQVEAEQKKLDQRLRDHQFYTRSLIESHMDALVITDPLGIITDANKQMEALTGCTATSQDILELWRRKCNKCEIAEEIAPWLTCLASPAKASLTHAHLALP
jgi:PAS domain-containing protein